MCRLSPEGTHITSRTGWKESQGPPHSREAGQGGEALTEGSLGLQVLAGASSLSSLQEAQTPVVPVMSLACWQLKAFLMTWMVTHGLELQRDFSRSSKAKENEIKKE